MDQLHPEIVEMIYELQDGSTGDEYLEEDVDRWFHKIRRLQPPWPRVVLTDGSEYYYKPGTDVDEIMPPWLIEYKA